jgi:hypothetical protein
MSEYLDGVRRYAPDAPEETVEAIVKYLGIALHNRDSSLVSCSDPNELARVRDNFCRKKLGLEQAVADHAIEEVCRQMSEDRNKHRVTFYYLVAEKSGTLAKLT